MGKRQFKFIMLSNINNFHGISLNMESSYSNPILNAIRPAVLKLYNGLNLDYYQIMEELKYTHFYYVM